MAYDRYDTRNAPRDERSRWRDSRDEGRGGREDRGFFERAGDEVASWFGDEDAERRRREDRMREERENRYGGPRASGENRGYGREDYSDRERGRSAFTSSDQERERSSRERDRGHRGERNRDWYETRGLNERGGFSERDYNPSWRRELSGPGNRERDWDRERGYRPMTGDYGRHSPESDQFFAASGYGRGERGFGDYSRDDDGQSPWGRDEYRRTSRAGTSDWTDRSRHEDPHYESWRRRHMSDLDRDYEDYRRENQSRFEDDFASWRERRQQKRGLLGQIREHMEVVGKDGQHVGTVDKTAGDRLILTKSDPESGGVHHSLSCADIDRVEGDRVILDCSADDAKKRWRDESRSRALFEREDQGEMGPRVLDRSFEGTYR
jgi:hypothetical protein